MKRNVSLDFYRGLSLVSMFFFHAYYDAVFLFAFCTDFLPPLFTLFWQQSIVLSFIFIAGAATCYSTSLVRHGLKLELWGVLITAVTYFFMPTEFILFGVLSFLGTALLLVAPWHKFLLKQKTSVLRGGAVVVLLAFLLTQGLARGYLGCYGFSLVKLDYVGTDLASFILGLPTEGFRSADYVPLLPHIFIFLLGRFCWQAHLVAKSEPKAQPKAPNALLATLGQHSLGFYLLHQIILYIIMKMIVFFTQSSV